jgi:DNA-binding NarL/FixJ family response regulator
MNQALPSGRLYRILIADDCPIFRIGLRTLLSSEPGIEVCGEATNGREILDLLNRANHDLIIMDVNMPQVDGPEVIRLIRQTHPQTRIVGLTTHTTDDFIRRALHAGVNAYILKSDPESELVSAIVHLRRNEVFLTSEVWQSITKKFVRNPTGTNYPNDRLTEREVVILTLLAKGSSNKEVAYKIHVSTRTVEAHRHHIMHKMAFSSLSDLVRFAVRNHLVEP